MDEFFRVFFFFWWVPHLKPLQVDSGSCGKKGIFTAAEVLQISLKASRFKKVVTYSAEIKIKMYLPNKSIVCF